MSKLRMAADLSPKVGKVLKNADAYHQQYYSVKTFGGPSLHFHRRALMLTGPVSEPIQTELIYAVLASWGMHRMGKGGSKMLSFDAFRNTVLTVQPVLPKAKMIMPRNITDGDWTLLEDIFRDIKVMASKTSIVGNSKVMAHLLPNAIAPIDRQYTLKFLFGNGNITNDLGAEWLLLRKIHEEFFYPIATDASFQRQAAKWMADQVKWPWDTSILKIIDNLVIGSFK